MQDPGFAPAKINLTLHVTGQRGDGYHLLDSLVVFADVGDRVTARPAPDLSLHVTGPEGAGLTSGDDNLVLRAARSFAAAPGAALVLEKVLPAASGIGGGSSDAAAALRVLAQLWGRVLPEDRGLSLGADVPVCLDARACRMSGVGEVLRAVPPLPSLWAVLANPRLEVPTPQVFRALHRRDGTAMPADLPRWRDALELSVWLRQMRNDLESPARQLAPPIGQVLTALQGLPGALLARMSGSGATCFALFADPLSAAAAASTLRDAQPQWWVQSCALG
jgi:4-diphosphocytidyl-2-C-methyl-D-erythritol kinase